MPFSIHRSTEQGLDLIWLQDDEANTRVAVIPQFGALLHAFILNTSEGAFNVIDQYESLAELEKELSLSYKGAKMSPFACRIPEGKYQFDGKQYEFRNKFMDGSAIHGLLFNKPFRVTAEKPGKESATLTLEYRYQQDDDQYPFDYTCQVVYSLFADHRLAVTTTLTNEGSTPMPIADGWHPYFKLGGKINDWILHFHAASQVEFDENLIPTGRLVEYDTFNLPGRIGKTVLDNCFLLNAENDLAACEIFNPNNKLKIAFHPGNEYPYLQIYTPPHRESIAIENLSGAPNSFNNKMGLVLLPPALPKAFRVEYQLSML